MRFPAALCCALVLTTTTVVIPAAAVTGALCVKSTLRGSVKIRPEGFCKSTETQIGSFDQSAPRVQLTGLDPARLLGVDRLLSLTPLAISPTFTPVLSTSFQTFDASSCVSAAVTPVIYASGADFVRVFADIDGLSMAGIGKSVLGAGNDIVAHTFHLCGIAAGSHTVTVKMNHDGPATVNALQSELTVVGAKE